jgi:hypothetical protein
MRARIYPVLAAGVSSGPAPEYPGLKAACLAGGSVSDPVEVIRIAHRDYGYGFKWAPVPGATDGSGTLTLLGWSA